MKLKTLAACVAVSAALIACGGGSGPESPVQPEGCWSMADYQGLIAGGVLQPLPATRPASWLWDGIYLIDPQGIPLPGGPFGPIAFAPVAYGPYYEPGRIPAFVCQSE